jgi:MFS family permease
MQLIVPEILDEARGFSVAVSATAFALGLLLWLLGWRGHRFWIVLVTTIGAGVWGLSSGPLYGTPGLVVALLLAFATGVLALALVRVLAFAAGGLAIVLATRTLVPQWDEPLVCFLVGGLLGLLLFRVWMMALTSAAGTLLMAYAGLCLTDHFVKLDVVALADKKTNLLNGVCGGVALLGLVVQFVLDRRKKRAAAAPAPRVRPQLHQEVNEGRRSWMEKLPFYRRAG